MDIDQSQNYLLLEKAKTLIPGGANSNMRAMPYQNPLVVKKAYGPHIWDGDGRELIDMNMGYGPLIFGHRPKFLVDAIKNELDTRGSILGHVHELSYEVAKLVVKSFPSIEQLRFTSSGTEALQTALRLARAYTNRSVMVAFEGHYHGSSDSIFHRYHAPLEELEKLRTGEIGQVLAGTAGQSLHKNGLIVLPWNNFEMLEEVFIRYPGKIAACIMEPVMGNAGVILPEGDFLKKVRTLTLKHRSLLIFDEVITGFRVARGGAQEYYGVQSDLTTLSKALNGGVPVSAVGGKKEIMGLISSGRVFHGGVYSGNPFSLAGVLATQQQYDQQGKSFYENLNLTTHNLSQGLREIFQEKGINIKVQEICGMITLWMMNDAWTGQDIKHYRDVCRWTDHPKFIRFQQLLQEEGVYVHPNHFEPWYLSQSHDQDVISKVLDKVRIVAKKM